MELDLQIEPVKKTKWKKIIEHPLPDISIFVLIVFIKMWILGDVVLYGRQAFMLTFSAEILTVISLFLIGLTSYYMSRRGRIIYFISWSLFFSIFLFLCTMYYRKFGDFPSLTMISLFSQLGDVKESLFTLFSFKDFWLFIDVILATFLYIVFRKRINAIKRFYTITHMFVMVLVFFFIVGVSGIATMEVSGDYEQRNASRVIAVKAGFINYLVMDVTSFVKSKFKEEKINEEELQNLRVAIRENQTDLKDGDYYGLFQNKNLMFVQLESYSGFLVDLKVAGQKITPNLNELVSSSYYMKNFYTEIGGGHSADAELTSMTSLYPLDRESVHVMHADNDYSSLAFMFNSVGYETLSAHAHRGDFWNRAVMHPSLGFSSSWFKESFTEDEIIGMGLSDESFMRQSINKLSNVKKPFMSYFITLESHEPFYLPEEEKELELGELEGTKIGNYLHSAHHTDKAIGELIAELKREGIYEDTVIVMYGDHDVEYDAKELNKLFDIEETEMILERKVPFLIHDPSQTLLGVNESIMGHMDIAPTILHLWGISPVETFFFGSNIFSSEQRGFTRLHQGHIVTNDYALLNADNTEKGLIALDVKTKKEIQITDEMKSFFKKVQEEYKMSNQIIRGDLISRLSSQK